MTDQSYFKIIYNFRINYRPNNLKTLFRPVTMMRPNILQITAVSLCASGYKNAKLIAKKITKLYRTCSEILPPEAHYDFGRPSIISFKMNILIYN